MQIKVLDPHDIDLLVPLVANFRVSLKALKGIQASPHLQAAKSEIEEYLQAGFPIYIAIKQNQYVGYIVIRIDSSVVWVESIYVSQDYRRDNVAPQLFKQAQTLAQSMGEDTVYNYVHPNNDAMIAFLRKQGYSVLNLIEIRKPHPNEAFSTKIQIGNNSFNY